MTSRTVGAGSLGTYVDLAERHGVFVIPGRCFEVDNRFFRLGFGGTTTELTAGLERLGGRLAAP